MNVSSLEKLEGDTFDAAIAAETGRDPQARKDGLKMLGSGELTRKITVKAHIFSKSALEKIQAAGGTAEVIGSRRQVSGRV